MKAMETLLGDFPKSGATDWRDAAEQLLKGKSFDKLMKGKTPEGIELEPIFFKEILDDLPASKTLPGFDGYLRGTTPTGNATRPWSIAQDLTVGTPKTFNKVALAAIKSGQQSLRVTFDYATLKGINPPDAKESEVGDCGLSLATLADLQTAFDGINPTEIPIHLSTRSSGLEIAALFFAWAEKEGFRKDKLKGSFAIDPLADLASFGRIPNRLSKIHDEQFCLTHYCIQHTPEMQALGVSSLPYHWAGASATQELGTALASGVHYLNAMTERGLTVDAIAPQIRFTLSIGSNFFMEIAKFRAIRVLWAQVVKAFGGNAEAQKISLHARTGLTNKTRLDPYVNILRTNTEALSAALAGVDSVCVGHFDETMQGGNEMSQRIARNSQIILQEECGLCEVADPAGGSWAIEWLTDQVAKKSWSFFQEIEAHGTIENALRNGFIADAISKTAEHKKLLFQQRRSKLVGTNLFPNSSEEPFKPDVAHNYEEAQQRIKDFNKCHSERSPKAAKFLDEAIKYNANSEPIRFFDNCVQAASEGASLGEISQATRLEAHLENPIKPLPHFRLSEGYEALRDATHAFAKKNGQPPRIQLINIGSIKNYKPRADFSSEFFATGGFEITASSGLDEPRDIKAILEKTNPSIVVICGSDADYQTSFKAFAASIKGYKSSIKVVLAGNPRDEEADYRAAGMDDFIHVHSNNYQVNRTYLAELGIL